MKSSRRQKVLNPFSGLLLFTFIFVNALSAFAGPGKTTYQAKIVKPDGYPLETSSVNFKFTILNPAGSCVLYSETYSSVNMSSTSGLISFSLGSGVKTYPASATTFEQVFSNITPSLSCDTGGPASYSPAASDIRKIVMQFHDGTGWQTLPAMSINAVPYAMYANEATKLNGLTSSDFVQLSTVPTCAASEALRYTGAGFNCIVMGSTASVTSSTVITALGYTPADGVSVTTLTSNVSSVSSTVFSVSSTVTSLQNSVATSFAAITSSQWTTSGTNIFYNTGNVGIGTTTPVTKLDVSGGVRIGAESTTCAPSLAGTLRYNASNVEYCNGTSWQAFGVSGAGINNFNGSTSGTQTLATSTGGTAPNIVTANGVHTLNIPNASTGSVTAGLISNADYTTFTNKITSSAASIAQVLGYVPADNAVSGTYVQKANNLSDLTNVATARTNLGLGTFATASSIDLGSASATGTLAIARLPSFTGDATIAAASSTIILANSGVTAGTYTKVTVDSKGRVTSSSALASSDVTTALGYTPASASASTQWTTSGTDIYYNTGSVGVGTATPQTKLDVSGGVRIGMESVGCGAALAGTVRYNAGAMQYCNGTTWESIITGYTNSNDSIFIGSGTTQTGTSSNNTALGVTALASLTGGSENIAIGNEALYSNTSGYANTAIGWESLYANTTGGNNTAVGNESMAVNTTGYSNSALGSWALYRNTTGGYNTAVGESVLDYNSSGQYNVGLGMTAGRYNTSGHFNTFLGTNAGRGQGINLSNVSGSTIVGYGAGINILTGADGNTLLGYRVGDNITTGAKNIIIGYDIDATTATASNTLNIGNLIFGSGVNGVGTTLSTGNVGIGVSAPTAKLHLAAGTSSNASLKLTSGTLLTSPQSGTIEYDGFNFYVTDSTNTRRTIATGSSAGTIDNASNINSSGNITMTPIGSVIVSSTTASTNSSTGALVVKGGLGVAGNINTAGNLNVSGSSVIDGSLKLSNMTSGSVLFAGANGTVTQDNANFYWDGANRRLGIGTSSPTEVLQIASGGLRVNGAIGATNVGGVYLDWNSGANIGRVIAGNASTSVLTFSTNTGGATSERMRIDSSGNVGIGTSAPTVKLDVVGDIKSSGVVYTANVQEIQNNGIQLYSPYNSTNPYIDLYGGWAANGKLRVNTNMQAIYPTVAGGWSLGTSTNPMGNGFFSGNVGIGTTAPQTALHVAKDITSQNAVSGSSLAWNGNSQIKISSGNNALAFSVIGTVNQRLGIIQAGHSGDGLNYYPDLTDPKLALQPYGGNVGIGTTSPGAKLHVSGSALFQNGGTDGNRAQGATINIGGGAYVSGTDPSDSNRNLALTTNTNNTGVVLTLRNTARSIFWDIVGQGTGNDRLDFNTYNGGAYSTKFSLEGTTGNVGIGTTNPSGKLHSVGGILTSNPTLGTDGTGAVSTTLRSGLLMGANHAIANNMFWISPDANVGGRLNIGHGNTFSDSASLMTVMASGNVGIGTVSPNEKLDVNGVVKATAFVTGTSSYTLAQNAGDTWVRFASGASNSFAEFRVSGSSSSQHGYFVVQISCNFPNGNTDTCSINMPHKSEHALQIVKSIRIVRTNGTYDPYYVEFLIGNNPDTTNNVTVNVRDNSNFTIISPGIAGSIPGGYFAQSINVDSLKMAMGNGQLNITKDGNVGIGTTNPTTELQIYKTKTGVVTSSIGNTTTAANDGASFQLLYGSTEIGSYNYYWTGSQFQNRLNYYGDLAFTNQGTEKIRFTAAGNVGVGTTAPTEKLEVSGSLKVTGEIYGQKSWAFKKGPSSYVSDYTNAWASGGGAGSGIDCTSSANGCTILKSGTYEIRCVQRANSTTSTFVGIALNGDRTALESRADAVWTHDHALGSGQYSESNFMGTLTAGNFITCGPAAANSTYMTYGAPSYNGSITIKRID